MRVFIQDKRTKHYLKASGLWTEDRDEAIVFLSSLKAMEFCHQNNLLRVNIVLGFSEPRFDIYICPFEEKERTRTEP